MDDGLISAKQGLSVLAHWSVVSGEQIYLYEKLFHLTSASRRFW